MTEIHRIEPASHDDIRDLVFEINVCRIVGKRAGLMISMLRRIGAERGIMTHIETVAAEYADLFLRNPEHVDLDHNRPRLVVIEGTADAVNDADEPGDTAA